ncbi:hypothetical protein [Streptomyces flavofungini]|uniref:Lipoprotein n=1 Tax=Streptomyces flavofungini TaxID=68200 RepID=A0ABS0XDV9_9ACTN|nr:hypothetical protein [Streptomyces flavofungini]MBJ3811394.1 hypothetical protein [Streptomyces flavofungini]GHC42623.1 hypothetical protein GCM10010349_03530 [Streptomyces flavofungini]
MSDNQRGRKAVTAVAGIGIVAVLGVGAYIGFGDDSSDGGGGGGGSAAVKDDGPHKLIAPKTVLDGYKQLDGITSTELEEHARFGVHEAENVQTVYGNGSKGDDMGGGMIQFTGAYGKIADPEKTVDAMFTDLSEKAEKGPGKGGEKSTWLGDGPEDFSADGAVLKCQASRVEDSSTAARKGLSPKEARLALCVWADHSTVAVVLPMDTRAIKEGKAASLDEAATTTKKLRKEVRVKR